MGNIRYVKQKVHSLTLKVQGLQLTIQVFQGVSKLKAPV
jgi:hypothetical protein